MQDRTYTVQPGGLFHVHKVKYSPETERFLKELIRESKLSIFQRKKVEESVRNGQPLPLPPQKTACGSRKADKSLDELDVRPNILPRRRKFQTIKQSGAYERDSFVPSYEKSNHDSEKTKLQELMAFGRTLKKGKLKKSTLNLEEDLSTKASEECSRESILHGIAEEIYKRNKFLGYMESIGQGKKYKEIIDQEIAAKLRMKDKVIKQFNEIEERKKKSGTLNKLFF